jgi:tetratricopeptide (TPR) repeat protein
MCLFGRMLIGSLFAVAGIAVLAGASIVLESFEYGPRGERYLSKGEVERAIALYSRAIWFNPQDHRPYSLRGQAHYLKHDYEHAIADLSRFVELEPDFPSAFCDLGIVKFHAGDFEGASGDMLRCSAASSTASNRAARDGALALQATYDLTAIVRPLSTSSDCHRHFIFPSQ